MSNKTTRNGGVGFGGLLAVAFIVLKLCGVTEVAKWSWWWVLSPLWIGWLILIVIAVICAAIAIWADSR